MRNMHSHRHRMVDAGVGAEVDREGVWVMKPEINRRWFGFWSIVNPNSNNWFGFDYSSFENCMASTGGEQLARVSWRSYRAIACKSQFGHLYDGEGNACVFCGYRVGDEKI